MCIQIYVNWRRRQNNSSNPHHAQGNRPSFQCSRVPKDHRQFLEQEIEHHKKQIAYYEQQKNEMNNYNIPIALAPPSQQRQIQPTTTLIPLSQSRQSQQRQQQHNSQIKIKINRANNAKKWILI